MTESATFIRKAYDFNKNGFETACNAMGSFQDQAQEVSLRLINDNPLFPEPAKKIMKSGFDACKESQVALKGQVEKTQKAFEELLAVAKI